MKKILLLFICILVQNLFAQSQNIKGTVVDSINNQPLIGANVIILDQKNNELAGTATNLKGQFFIDKVSSGRYTLKLTYIGYNSKQIKFEVYGNALDLKIIKLSQKPVNIDEVEVRGKAILVMQNKDTTEFLADAVQTNKDANAEDLISKMPGVVVQDGKVQAQGEDVKNVLVDGKQYFGEDPNAVLRNMPAEVIDKIQVFDKQSEQAEFTGFDDGNASKTINIITKMRFRNGTFGKLAAGYGSEEKYVTGGNINYFNNRQKITLLGQLNNINEQNFSSEDLLGVMGENSNRRGGFVRPGGGGRGGQGGGNQGGGNQGGGQRDVSDFLVDSKNGLTQTKAIGLNYTDFWFDKIDFNMSYFLNNTNNNSDTKLEREYLLSSIKEQKYFENNSSGSKNTNHRINIRFDYQIDSMNSILFRQRLTVQNNDGNSNIFGNTTKNNSDLNKIKNDFSSLLNAYNFNSNLLFRHKFETKGRTASIGFITNYRKNSGDNRLYSENTFFDTTGVSDTINQYSDLKKNLLGYTANLTYTEPIMENSLIQLNASYANSKEESDLNSFKNSLSANSFILDSSLSNVYSKYFSTQNYGISYLFRKEDFSIDFGLRYNISSLTNNQTFPHSLEMIHKFYSVQPSLMFRYSFSRTNNIQINYRTNNNEPSVEQLQNVLDNSNPLQLSIGNPNLAQDYRHSLSLRYSLTNLESFTSFFIMLNGTYTQNYITNKTIIAENSQINYNGIILNPGTQLRIPENMDGYYNLRSMMVYGMQLSLIKSNVNFSFGVNISRTPGKINDIINYSSRNIYDLGFVISSNISKEFDFSVSGNGSYNTVQNSSKTSLNQNYFNQRARLRLYWLIAYGFLFTTDFEFKHNESVSSGYDPNSYYWNISIGKKLFDNDQGEIRVTIYDVLNKNINNVRTANDLYVENSNVNVLGRYVILTFSYNLKAF